MYSYYLKGISIGFDKDGFSYKRFLLGTLPIDRSSAE
jgi:hypothetical protein